MIELLVGLAVVVALLFAVVVAFKLLVLGFKVLFHVFAFSFKAAFFLIALFCGLVLLAILAPFLIAGAVPLLLLVFAALLAAGFLLFACCLFLYGVGKAFLALV